MALERERERESRNLGKIEEREGLYSKNRPLFICTTKLTQGRSVNDNASSILEMQSIRKNYRTKSILNAVSGITLIALVVTIVVLLILASVSITVVFGDNGILQLAKEAGEKTNEAVKNDQDQISDVEGVINEYLTELKSPIKSSVANEEVTFATNYGTIDVIWLDTNNRVKSVPNEPILSAKSDSGKEETMTKVKWTYNEETKTWGNDEVPSSNADWYNYQKAEGTDDTKKSRWANAKTANGSYFVWIPRYAYRITYYANEENIEEQEPTGYYDGWGMYDKDGNLKYKLDEGIETVAYNGNKYIVHPAFMDNRENNFDNGGWDKDLAGFWFAKYEMSGNSETVERDYNELKSVPEVSSLRYMTIGAMYQVCRNATYKYMGQTEKVIAGGLTDTDKKEHTSYMNSHLAKNSEWGAVAYLAHSSYGRNGHEIDVNNNADYITGNGCKDIDSGITYKYNTETGAKASTTGNIYGVYDMSGGAWEYVASYDKKGDSSKLTDLNMGLDLTKETKSNIPSTEDGIDYEYISTKYATAYENGTSVNGQNKVLYSVGKVGDATKEVGCIGELWDSYRWFRDYSLMCHFETPFSIRGGHNSHTNGAGVFSSSYDNGKAVDVQRFSFCSLPIVLRILNKFFISST